MRVRIPDFARSPGLRILTIRPKGFASFDIGLGGTDELVSLEKVLSTRLKHGAVTVVINQSDEGLAQFLKMHYVIRGKVSTSRVPARVPVRVPDVGVP